MRIAIINTYENSGGAARAAERLFRGLENNLIDVKYLVRKKRSTNPNVVEVPIAQAFYGNDPSFTSRFEHDYVSAINRYFTFTDPSFPHGSPLIGALKELSPTVINLHWVREFVDYRAMLNFTLVSKIPIVWTLHDMNLFTGGCHYDSHCGGFKSGCGSCPILKSDKRFDLSYAIHREKRALFENLPKAALTLVSPSKWLANLAVESAFFADQIIRVIPNGIETDIYFPLVKKDARASLGIPVDDHPIILFIAQDLNDPRKGIDQLERFISLNPKQGDFYVILVGRGDLQPNSPILRAKQVFKTEVDDGDSAKLRQLYSVADFSLVLSDQDNYPNTCLESLSCGTPVFGFNSGGVAEMISHRENGFLVPREFSLTTLAEFNSILFCPTARTIYSVNARNRVIKYNDLDTQAKSYFDLYRYLENSLKSGIIT